MKYTVNYQWPPTPSRSYALQVAIVALKKEEKKHWCGTCAQMDRLYLEVLEKLKDELLDQEVRAEENDSESYEDYY